MNKGGIKILVISSFIALALIILSSIICSGSSKGKGDGKTSCKNCGKKSVYALGFCKSCYESFYEYTYKNKNGNKKYIVIYPYAF